MASFSIFAFVMLLFCSSMIFTPISVEVNIYFLNNYSTNSSISHEMLFYILLGSTIGAFLTMIGEWKRILFSLFVSSNDIERHRNNSFTQLWLIACIFIFTLIFGALLKLAFSNFVPDAFYSLALLLGLLLNIFFISMVVKLGNKRAKEYYQLRFLSFIVIALIAALGFLPGVALILPMILIFRIFGVSVYQSLKFTLMIFTLLATVLLFISGRLIDFTGLWQINVFSVFISGLVTFIVIKWFAIFSADDIKIFNIFKKFAWVQVFILVIWFL